MITVTTSIAIRGMHAIGKSLFKKVHFASRHRINIPEYTDSDREVIREALEQMPDNRSLLIDALRSGCQLAREGC